MKTCFRCNRELPLTDFYKAARMTDGLMGKCKVCCLRDKQENYARHREQYREYDRARSKLSTRQAGIRASEERHPLQQWCRYATTRAIVRGILEKKPCEICGEQKVDVHHEDYTQPLKVRFLCRIHHMELHRAPALVPV